MATFAGFHWSSSRPRGGLLAVNILDSLAPVAGLSSGGRSCHGNRALVMATIASPSVPDARRSSILRGGARSGARSGGPREKLLVRCEEWDLAGIPRDMYS